jgi:hypothetical protein
MNQLKNNLLQLRIVSGFADFFKTTSNLYVACGLIFKGLMSYFSIDNLPFCHKPVA